MKFKIAVITAAAVLASAWTGNASITGNPLNDGWTPFGNSLDQGTYVTGSANYGYETFGAGFTVQSGSSLVISDGAFSWDVGDTVVAVGGVFQAPTAPGWTISGTPVNSLLASATLGPKLQAKFGTSAASWYTSTSAPGSGNGSSGSSAGGGRVQVRTSGWLPANPTVGELYSWAGNSGQLLVPEDGHVSWDGGTLDERVARMIWNYNSTTGEVGSWELLLNVSLISESFPAYTGLLPGIGAMAIMTVQNGDSAYTDALVNAAAVPEPTTMIAGALLLLPFGLSTLRILRKSRKA